MTLIPKKKELIYIIILLLALQAFFYYGISSITRSNLILENKVQILEEKYEIFWNVLKDIENKINEIVLKN